MMEIDGPNVRGDVDKERLRETPQTADEGEK